MKNKAEPNKIYDTSLKVKRKYIGVFFNLMKDQIVYGGSKYAQGGEREATDWVCELVPGKTGVDWILGTIAKYLGRFRNKEREKDLLKIASWAFIAWLKKGYHLKENHDTDTWNENKK